MNLYLLTVPETWNQEGEARGGGEAAQPSMAVENTGTQVSGLACNSQVHCLLVKVPEEAT